MMKTLHIVGTKNQNSEGITLLLNEPVALNGGVKTREWWVSWDRIGATLFGDEYCDDPRRNNET